jgi:hypothetical protein
VQVKKFFVAELTSQPSARACSAAIKKAILVAQFAFSYNNFNTLMEILAALCSPAVTCNEKAWDVSAFP